MIILLIFAAIIIIALTLISPYLGLAFTLASVSIVGVLPTIPYITSATPLLGGITFVSSLFRRRVDRQNQYQLFRLKNVHVWGLLLVGWIFVSNPQAAWFGEDRNWVFTYIQLLILLWLAGKLLDTPHKHQVLMWIFSLFTVASALIALQQGGIGDEIDPLLRVSGLAEGSNTAARYFVVALVFLNYLHAISSKNIMKLLAIGGMIVSFFGVFVTVSRTGMVLLAAAIGLHLLLRSEIKYRIQITFVAFIVTTVLWLISGNIFNILQSILPSIITGSDTMGLRYAFWKAGWRMWLAYPIQGVGVGMYAHKLIYFGQDLLPVRYLSLVSHNMYVQMLSETGLVGFVLFLALVGSALQNFWRSENTVNPQMMSLRNTWLIVFLIMLLGGITKTDQADKILWFMMGVSVYFLNQKSTDSKTRTTPKESEPENMIMSKQKRSTAKHPYGK